jgi:hypothetical protein
MTTFDYKTAWQVLAKPSYDRLPPEITGLIRIVSDRAMTLQQGRKILDIPMPDDIREEFESIDSETMASASRIIYFYGHWGSSESYAHWGTTTPISGGTYWKFANLADQILSRRCEIYRLQVKLDKGVSYAIHQGIIRCQISTPEQWTWDEIAPATPENYRAMLVRKPSTEYEPDRSRVTRDAWADRMTSRNRAMMADFRPWQGMLAGWDNTDRFMV